MCIRDSDGIEPPTPGFSGLGRDGTIGPYRALYGSISGSCRAGPDDDRVVGSHDGSSVPACSATMYAAYHSGQFASLPWPSRASYLPWAASARRNAAARSFADAKVVTPESMRPGSRVVTSWNSQPLPSGSRLSLIHIS